MLKEILETVDSVKLYRDDREYLYWAEWYYKDVFNDASDKTLNGLFIKVKEIMGKKHHQKYQD